MDAHPQPAQEYLALLWRRKTYCLIAASVVGAGALAVTLALPKTYRATATLLMDVPVPKDALQATFTELAGERVRAVAQKAMTTANVLDLIEAADLYPAARGKLGQDELAAQFRRDAEVRLLKSELAAPGAADGGAAAFTLSFAYSNPQQAQAVAQRLAGLFIEQNDRERTQRANRAADFLTTEAAKLAQDIAAVDTQIAGYKQHHKDNLPDQLPNTLAALDRKQGELRDTEQQARLFQERLSFLEVELAKTRRTDPAPDPERTGAPLSREDTLRALQERYARLAARYTPNHPDVLNAKRQLEALDPGGTAAARAAPLEAPLSPAYLAVEAQRHTSQLELDAAQRKALSLKAELEELRARLLAAPEVEKGYQELVRERDHRLHKYNQVKEKLLDARLVNALEHEQHGQTLTVVEPPLLPSRPDLALQKKAALAGLALALGAGLGAAVLADWLDPRVRGGAALTRVAGLTPLAVIPYFESPGERRARLAFSHRWRRRVARAGVAAALLALLAGGGWLYAQKPQPLPLAQTTSQARP